VRKIRVLDAILTRFAESALKGDTKAATFLLQRYDLAQPSNDPSANTTTPEEQEIIETYLEAYLKRNRSRT
jgi:hypothetical protein